MLSGGQRVSSANGREDPGLRSVVGMGLSHDLSINLFAAVPFGVGIVNSEAAIQVPGGDSILKGEPAGWQPRLGDDIP